MHRHARLQPVQGGQDDVGSRPLAGGWFASRDHLQFRQIIETGVEQWKSRLVRIGDGQAVEAVLVFRP